MLTISSNAIWYNPTRNETNVPFLFLIMDQDKTADKLTIQTNLYWSK